jgi:RNA recognition motif-containing protein
MKEHRMLTLIVSNLPPETTPSDLERIFARHGQVAQAQIAISQKTGQIQNFGLVQMPEADARWAQETLHRSWYKNSCIEVQFTQLRGPLRHQRSKAAGGRWPEREVHLVSGF